MGQYHQDFTVGRRAVFGLRHFLLAFAPACTVLCAMLAARLISLGLKRLQLFVRMELMLVKLHPSIILELDDHSLSEREHIDYLAFTLGGNNAFFLLG